MTTNAEVLKIPIDSSDFTKFAELFDKYQAQLAKTPNAWKAAGAAQSAMATQFERMSAALLAQNELNRQRAQDDAHHLKNLQQSESLWHRISTHSGTLFSNVLGISGQFLKWGGLLAGTAVGVATGSLFGYDRLAAGIGGERTAAKGLGLTIGQSRALGIDLGRFGDVQGQAQSVLTMETDLSKRTPWYELGLGKMSGNESVDLIRFMNAERAFALRTPTSMLGTIASKYGLNASDLFMFKQFSNSEWQTQMQKYQHDSAALNISDRSAMGAQNVQNQFSRAWKQMETGLWNALTPLSGPIIHLSQAFTHTAIAVLGSPAVKQGINDFADWIKKFSTSIDSQSFEAKLKNFTGDVGMVADGMHVLASVFKAFGGLGGIASGYGGAKVGGWIGSIFGLPGRVIGTAVGAGVGIAAHDVATHPQIFGAAFSGMSAAFAPSLRQLTDQNLSGNVSASTLRSRDLGFVAPIATQVPQIRAPALSAAPVNITLTVHNATGSDLNWSLNGLAGY